MYQDVMEGLREYLGRWAKGAEVHKYVPLPCSGESPELFLDSIEVKMLEPDDCLYLWKHGTAEYFRLCKDRVFGYR